VVQHDKTEKMWVDLRRKKNIVKTKLGQTKKHRKKRERDAKKAAHQSERDFSNGKSTEKLMGERAENLVPGSGLGPTTRPRQTFKGRRSPD